MNEPTSMTPAYFEALYAADADPWCFATSAYERTKYAATMQALPSEYFSAALEVGCSIGVLTQQLAGRCATLLSIDVAETALMAARDRCSGLGHVTFARMQIPDEWPDRRFDLILLSEVLYYLFPADIARTAERAAASLSDGGAILLVHYILPTNYPCSGDEAAEMFIRSASMRVMQQRREAAYRLDLLQV